MKRLIVLICLILLALAGCAELRDPAEPLEDEGSRRPRFSSPFWDATRPADSGDMPAWADRPAEETKAWRQRHR